MQRCEIIELGEHRLMCGDATSHEDISRLMQNSHAKLLFTSPPYSDIYIYGGNDISPEHLAEFIPASKDYADIMCVNLGLKKKNHEIIPYWNEYISAAHKCGGLNFYPGTSGTKSIPAQLFNSNICFL